jgi:hypothetical protein
MPVPELKDDCTPEEAVALIRSMPANPAQIRPATESLAEVLQSAQSDPSFELESWQHQWSAVCDYSREGYGSGKATRM